MLSVIWAIQLGNQANAKLQMTVYPSKSTPILPILRQHPFQTIPNKLFVDRTKKLVGDFLLKNSDFFGLLQLRNAPKTVSDAPEPSGNILK